MNELAEQIKNLELSLLDPKVRKSRAKLNRLLCDGFIEIGQSGTIYNKVDIIRALENDPHTDAVFSDFIIKSLSDSLVLASYTSQNLTTVKRHSLWENQGGKWRMLYHEAEKPNG